MLLIPKRHRQTDGRLTVALPRSALASRGKKQLMNFEKIERDLILRAVFVTRDRPNGDNNVGEGGIHVLSYRCILTK